MPIAEKPIVRTIHKRGSGVCVVIPPGVLKRLGWNLNDAVKLDCVNGRLLVTKIPMPTVDEMRLGEAGK